jgi:DNA processing protein
MNKQQAICILCSMHKGIGPVLFQELLRHFETADKLFDATLKETIFVLGKVRGKAFYEFKESFDFDKQQKQFQRLNITVISILDKEYPKGLREISDPPICLYVKGDFINYPFENKTHIAVVGTRKPTSYGQYVTKKITSELVESGVAIVSGMALGIDAISHKTTLNANGHTIAVLGCGVDIVYPRENAQIYNDIIKKGGLIVSEFPPGTISLKGHFVARNRIVSGISDGVLIVEGLRQSGSLITARYALNQGKDVFAPPCPINSDYSYAPNTLLKEGAKIVTEGADILVEYGVSQKNTPEKDISDLSAEQLGIINELKKESLTVDELSLRLSTPISKLLPELTICELRLLVVKNQIGKYQIN